MAGREVTITVFLTDADQALLARRVAEMNEFLARQGREAPPWTEERDLLGMICRTLEDERERFRRDDLWAAEQLRSAPLEAFPADLAAELDKIAGGLL